MKKLQEIKENMQYTDEYIKNVILSEEDYEWLINTIEKQNVNKVKTASNYTPKELLDEYGIVTVVEKYIQDEEAMELILDFINGLIDRNSQLKNIQERLFNLKNKYYNELTESKRLIEKLFFEAARTEDLVYAYATRNNLTKFSNKWEQKLYTDEDYTLYNLVGELIENIDKKGEMNMNQIIEKSNTVFKKVDAGFVVLKSRFGDLSESEFYTLDYVNEYQKNNENVLVIN